VAELWETAIMTVLFWEVANKILNMTAAKRYYTLLLTGGNLAAICAGLSVTTTAKLSGRWASETLTDPWQYSLLLLNGLVISTGIVIILIFRWLHKNVLCNPSYQNRIAYEAKNTKTTVGLRKTFKYLIESKYLLCIVLIAISYNICINLTEVTWKDQLLTTYPQANDYFRYMGKVTMWVGIAATIIAILSSVVVRDFSWTFNAMIPPILLFITGIQFFAFLIFKDSPIGVGIASFMGTSPLFLGVFFGAVQQCVSRASNYTIFDATKKHSFIEKSKLKGKAAIDKIGSHIGKSGSSLIYQALLMIFGTVSATIPYVGLILLIIIITWMVTVYLLGKRF
jgi:ATP:ADP antiporter, AAA family